MAVYHAVVEGEHADVSPVVDVVASYDGVAVVFHPDARQRIVADLIVLVDALETHTRERGGVKGGLRRGSRSCSDSM